MKNKSIGFNISMCIFWVLIALTEFITTIFYTSIAEKIVCLLCICFCFFSLSKQIDIVIEMIKENKK